MLFVCESITVTVYVCVYILMYWPENVCQGCCIQTDRFGLMDFIDFLSLYNELQGSQSVEGKTEERGEEEETSVRNNKK